MPLYNEASRPAQGALRNESSLEVPSPTPRPVIQKISLGRLAFSPAGCRKMNRQTIKALATRIQEGAQIGSLVVALGEEDRYYVVAGERRLAALQLLLEEGRITTSYPVPCRLIRARPSPEPAPVLAEETSLSYSVDCEKRRRFKDLRNRCPGLITGSELAVRQLIA
jgi:ParB-like nuclease domain